MVISQRYTPGALVRARGRDWVVIPADDHGVVRLRPVDGSDDNAVGLFTALEPHAISHTQYPLPDPSAAGDFTGALLLRDAVRLSLRSGAGPFRSMGRVSVTPRPYQFVPLIMALRLDPVRLLIADDVGVGKTIEAAMIARELLDRGVAKRIAVVCAPHLCDQWEQELREKFNIDAAVIQPSRIAKLERDLPRGDISIFQHYRHVVASIDFIKSNRYRRPFIDNAPDLVIVDEAHTAARPRGDRTGSQHQRYDFLRELAGRPGRHLILTTATPHSGIEESFRSLLGLLDPSFDLPEDRELPRTKLVPHVVQRRRSDLDHWLGAETPFPVRESYERAYRMSPAYVKLLEDVRDYCSETVSSATGLRAQQQRVRYWAAIAILRCVLSSPAAAEAMLDKRARGKQGESPADDDVEDLFSAQVLDSDREEQAADYAPTAPLEKSEETLTAAERRRLEGFLKTARSLAGPDQDRKLAEVATAVHQLLSEGYSPIVYCRFIATANYVAEQLQKLLKRDHSAVRVVAVTGEIGDEQRRELVDELAREPVHVLVATDCLSEGINLQDHFDAVVHYDLPWNPNRLEQREGRVDRYGQRKKTVKTVLLYGSDNEMDLVVLEVLIRKAKTIRQQLGIAVPVPVESDQVVQAVVDSVLLRRRSRTQQLQLDLSDPKVSEFHAQWDKAAERDKTTRAFFSQQGIKPDEVQHELSEMEPALGNAADIRRFVANALQRFNGELRETKMRGVFELQPGDLRQAMQLREPRIKFPLRVMFDGIPRDGASLLGRNHPVVTTITDAALARALSGADDQFSRCGAIFTNAVQTRTGVAVLRLRYLLEESSQQFAEEVVVAAFRRVSGGGVEWLQPLEKEGLRLLAESKPSANMPAAERTQHVTWALEQMSADGWWNAIVDDRVAALKRSHKRLRTVVKAKALTVTPHPPPDILGCYVLVPAKGGR
jgi:superfamily II DNA or RNA helicase